MTHRTFIRTFSHGVLTAATIVTIPILTTSACIKDEASTPTEQGKAETPTADTTAKNEAPSANGSPGTSPSAPAVGQIDRAAAQARAKQLFGSVAPSTTSDDPAIEAARVDLGRELYYDKRLSKGQDISCNSCHDLAAYGVDVREEGGQRLKTSKGHGGAMGTRNSPTVYGAFAHGIQFWDGRAKDVEEQAKGPVLNPVEMAMKDDKAVTKVLKSIPGYAPLFAKAFPGEKDPANFENAAKAIGAFERKLVTPSPFDQFIDGKLDALNVEQIEGLNLFVSSGCTACHMGPSVGGGFLQKLGLMKPWPTNDNGRFEVTKSEGDKFMFKVPSLRNIEKTGPYLHDGSIASLSEVVAKMAEYQTASGAMSSENVDKIVAFLDSLTGEIDKEMVKEPALPEGSKKTPKPSRG